MSTRRRKVKRRSKASNSVQSEVGNADSGNQINSRQVKCNAVSTVRSHTRMSHTDASVVESGPNFISSFTGAGSDNDPEASVDKSAHGHMVIDLKAEDSVVSLPGIAGSRAAHMDFSINKILSSGGWGFALQRSPESVTDDMGENQRNSVGVLLLQTASQKTPRMPPVQDECSSKSTEEQRNPGPTTDEDDLQLDVFSDEHHNTHVAQRMQIHCNDHQT